MESLQDGYGSVDQSWCHSCHALTRRFDRWLGALLALEELVGHAPRYRLFQLVHELGEWHHQSVIIRGGLLRLIAHPSPVLCFELLLGLRSLFQDCGNFGVEYAHVLVKEQFLDSTSHSCFVRGNRKHVSLVENAFAIYFPTLLVKKLVSEPFLI